MLKFPAILFFSLAFSSQALACADDTWAQDLGLKIHARSSTLQDAEIVLFGVLYGQQQRLHDPILRSLAVAGDTVFVEGIERGIVTVPTFVPQTAGLPTDLLVEGWDDARLARATRQHTPTAIRSQLWLRSFPAGTPGLAAASLRSNLLNQRLFAVGEARNEPLNATLSTRLPQLREQRRRSFLIAGQLNLLGNPRLREVLTGYRYVIVVPEVRRGMVTDQTLIDFFLGGSIAPPPPIPEIHRAVESALVELSDR